MNRKENAPSIERPMPRPKVPLERSGPEPHIFIVLILMAVLFTFVAFRVPLWASPLIWVAFLALGTIVARFAYHDIPRRALIVVVHVCLILAFVSFYALTKFPLVYEVGLIMILIASTVFFIRFDLDQTEKKELTERMERDRSEEE